MPYNNLCDHCGKALPEYVKFCPECGRRVSNKSPQAGADKIIRRKNILLSILVVIIIILVMSVIYLAAFRRGEPGSAGEKETSVTSNTADITDSITEQTQTEEPPIVTEEDAYNSALSKLKIKVDEAPVSGSADDYTYIYGELIETDTALTEQELTALLTYNRPGYDAVKDLEITINPDNTVDFSAVADTQRFVDDVLSRYYDYNDIAKTFPLIIFMPKTVDVSGTLSLEIADNKTADFNLTNALFMGIKIPESMYATSETKEKIIDSIDSYLADNTEKTGAYFDSVRMQNGELTVKGKIPSSVKSVPANP
ncbi:MAG: zinc ribbon domain-containing protein [Eubacteriales bacterium]|jgi:predicted nucleic acid-binding Zn ribbon protein|nr:zinc ribbon domain-containing protein [Eubacteriales bacterium]